MSIMLDIPEILYHATFHSRLELIRRDGLIVSPPSKSYRISLPGFACMAESFWDSVYFAECAENIPAGEFRNIWVISINTKILNPDLFSADQNTKSSDVVGPCYQYGGDIPAEAFIEIKFPYNRS